MNITCRILLGLGLTGAVAAALGYFWTAGPTPQPAPFSWSEEVHSPEQQEQRRARLDLYRARLFRGMEIKRRVAEDLLDGRLTLFQAVVQFQRAERGLPASAARLHILRQTFPGNSDAERWCRKVIRYLRATWPESARARCAARRLDQELDRHLRRYGTVRLPVLPPGWLGNIEGQRLITRFPQQDFLGQPAGQLVQALNAGLQVVQVHRRLSPAGTGSRITRRGR